MPYLTGQIINYDHKNGLGSLTVEPFNLYRSQLLRRLQFESHYTECHRLGDVEAALSRTADIVFVLTSWQCEPKDTIDLFERLWARKGSQKLVYVDSFDPSSSPFFGLVPFVDLYVKKQFLADAGRYGRKTQTGYIFSEFLYEQGCLGVEKYHFGSAIPPGYEDRFSIGWNIGVSTNMQHLLSLSRFIPFGMIPKDIDVICILNLGDENNKQWYYHARKQALDTVKSLPGRRVEAQGFFLGRNAKRWDYLQRMARSRIAFSPFGWGEICYRDFEAIACNCLLLKPDMSHLVTEPNIYKDRETYVAVKWDLSNLHELCEYYLDHQYEANKIIYNARRVYTEYVRGHGFVDRLGSICRKVGLSC